MSSTPVILQSNRLAVSQSANGILPLKHLIGQAGWQGYLLLANPLLVFLTARGRTEGYDTVDEQAVVRILYTLAIFLAATWYLALPKGRQVRIFLLSRPCIYLLLYVLVCILSYAWSERPLYSAYMGFECLAFLLLISVVFHRLLNRCNAQDVVEWIVFWLFWEILCRVLFRLYEGQLHYTIFRAAAFQTGIGFFLAAYLAKRTLLKSIVMMFALLSGINTLYASLIPGTVLGAFARSGITRVVCRGAIIGYVVGLMHFGFEPVMQETVFHGREGVGMEHTSGRNILWLESLDYIFQNPFLGYGFVSGERDRIFAGGVSVISVHNMLLSAALGVGIIGPVLLLFYFGDTALLCFRKRLPRGWKAGFIATLSSAFIFSLTNPGLGGRVYGAWLVTVGTMTMISMHSKIQPTGLPRRLRRGARKQRPPQDLTPQR